MKKYYLVLAFLATSLVACNKDPFASSPKHEEVLGNGLKYIEIAFSRERPIDIETKASLADVAMSFGPDDQIAVLATKAAVTAPVTLTYLRVEAGKVIFGGTIEEGFTVGNYAYYPASIATSSELTINWPTSVDGSKVQVPMMAYIGSGTATFKHLGAIAKIAVTNCPAGATKLKFTAAGNITGPYAVSDFTTGTPTVAPGVLTGATITANISGNGTYYIPLPVDTSLGTTFSGFQFALINSADTYYYKQKTATKSVGPLLRTHLVNFGTLDYDVDKIAEWWHVSPINGWTIGYDRYIKTGSNTYQLTVFNGSDYYWMFRDGSGNQWGVDGHADYWSGTITQCSTTFYRNGDDNKNKTFDVQLTTDGSSWTYSSSNWGSNSDRGWSNSTPLKLVLDGTEYSMEKNNYDAKYCWRYLNLSIANNNAHTLKFKLNGTLSGSSGAVSLTDSHPYGQAAWAGANNMSVTLTQGTYDVYLDLANLNFMFVKVFPPETPTDLEDMTLSSEYNI